MNSAATGNCDNLANMAAAGTIPFVFVARGAGYRILGITGYNPANCPAGANPPLPAVGTRGSDVTVAGLYDGWTGGVRLLDATTLAEADYFIIPEALDRRFTDQDFGILSIHEVATDPTHPVGYFAWYSAGAIVLDWATGEFRKTGQYIDEGGADVWGTQFHMTRDGRRYFVQSDRNYGLFVYRYGTDLRPTKVSSPRTARVGQTFAYRLRAANRGTIAETNTVLRDRLPAGVRFVSASTTQGRCSYRSTTRTVVCNLRRLVHDASSAVVTIRVRATRAGTVRNTAVLAGRQVEYDPTNNRAVARTRVLPAAVAGAGRLTGSR
jgi:uncharacterized repeat protein (TIGR01451 family)